MIKFFFAPCEINAAWGGLKKSTLFAKQIKGLKRLQTLADNDFSVYWFSVRKNIK